MTEIEDRFRRQCPKCFEDGMAIQSSKIDLDFGWMDIWHYCYNCGKHFREHWKRANVFEWEIKEHEMTGQ